MRIERVKAEAVYPLRLEVLRPGGILADCVFAGDDDPDTVHFAAFNSEGKVEGIASFYQASHPAVHGKRLVQLRGMATHPSVRGEGYGKAIVRFALGFFAGVGGALSEKTNDVMWCNAREVAIPFYETLGFQITAEPFDIPGIGPHRVMFRHIRR